MGKRGGGGSPCRALGCSGWASGKPYCIDHLHLMPGVAALLGRAEGVAVPPMRPKQVAFGKAKTPDATCAKCGQTKPIKARGMCGACFFDGFQLADREGTAPAKVRAEPADDEGQDQDEEPEPELEDEPDEDEEAEVIARAETKAEVSAPTGEAIKAWRDLHGVSQSQLGELVGGAGQSKVSAWERGVAVPPARLPRLVEIIAGGRPEGLPFTLGRRNKADRPASLTATSSPGTSSSSDRPAKPQNVLPAPKAPPASGPPSSSPDVPPELRKALGWLARGLDRAARVLERLAAGSS